MPSRFRPCLFVMGALLAGSACAATGGEVVAGKSPSLPEPVSCPTGTVRVERVFRSAEETSKIVGVNESCEQPDGLLDGPTADWHVIERGGSRRLARVHQGQYREGREVGVWRQWYANGEKRSERHYLPESEPAAGSPVGA